MLGMSILLGISFKYLEHLSSISFFGLVCQGFQKGFRADSFYDLSNSEVFLLGWHLSILLPVCSPFR